MTEATRRPCKFCQREIIFVTNQKTGKIVPLDATSRPHIYELNDAAEGGDIASPVEGEIFVSHFLTCPNATEASKKAKG